MSGQIPDNVKCIIGRNFVCEGCGHRWPVLGDWHPPECPECGYQNPRWGTYIREQ
jgi:rubrerythrin